LSRRSTRRRRRAKKTKAAKVRRFKVYMHLTVCPPRARKPDSTSWYVSNDPDFDPGIYWTCKTCGLSYLYRWRPERIEFYDFGVFNEPPDAVQLLAFVAQGAE
jgi:hypothetical protein